VREYAAQKQIDESDALIVGMNEKAEQFKTSGGEIYQNLK
jgi:phosphomethylpyrimidine synthase